MPKKPNFDNPVRLVREGTDKTQVQFAKLLGISAKYLQKIELGDRDLTDDLADFMTGAFGVTQDSVKQRRGRPIHLLEMEEPHGLRAKIQAWQSVADNLNRLAAQDLRVFLVPKFNVLLEAAQQKAPVGFRAPKAFLINLWMDRWINEAATRLKLVPAIRSILVAHKAAGNEVDWDRVYRFNTTTTKGIEIPSGAKAFLSPRKE